MAKKILVIDDDLQLVELLKMRLEANGYEVVVAFDGQEGLDKAHQENPNVIILDIMLPKIDGYKVCSMLRSEEPYKNIPIVMLTARGQANEIKAGMGAGAVAYLTKPFKPEVLLGTITKLVGK